MNKPILTAPSKRLSNAERRRQLLSVAAEMVREEGTDALTLATLAERAGVTKPVAYNHFGTREGLLVALYRDMDEVQLETTAKALEGNDATLEETVEVLSSSIIACWVSSGPAYNAISAALEGSAEMTEAKLTMRRAYLDGLRDAFSTHVRIPAREARAVLPALMGAADAVAAEVVAGRVPRRTGHRVLADLILATLEPYRRAP